MIVIRFFKLKSTVYNVNEDYIVFLTRLCLVFTGQPKRHLLTTGWSLFVGAKRLRAGDSVLFIRYDGVFLPPFCFVTML